MATSPSEFDWLYDYIVGFLKSPPWTTPLNTFIDDNCIIFDNEEENKLAFTDIHKKFVTLIDELLTTNLKDLGVTEEQFVQACERGVNQEVNKLIFGQILAVDDFLTFKKMMCKRNMELEFESLKGLKDLQISAPSTATGGVSTPIARTVTTAPGDLEEAIRLSQEMALLGTAKQQEQRVLDDQELEAALRASVVEQEVYNSQFQSEQAELEHAIAISLALEAERLRQAEAEEKAKADAEAKAKADAEAKAKADDDAKAGASAPTPTPPATPVKAASSFPSLTPAKSPGGFTTPFDSDSAGTTADVKLSAPTSSLPRIGAHRALGAQAAAEHAKATERVEFEFEKNKQAVKQNKEKAAEAIKSESKISDAELERRKAFLRQQRELILARKNKEREESLNKWKAEKSATPSAVPAALQAAAPSAAPEVSATEIEDQKRVMRDALASRLKRDMLDSESRRKATETQPDLHSQLKQAEEMRREKQRKEQAEADLLRAQEKERQQKLSEFHANLRSSGKALAASDDWQ